MNFLRHVKIKSTTFATSRLYPKLCLNNITINQTTSFSTCTALNRKKRIPTKTSKSSNSIGSPGMTIFLKINMVEAVKSEWVKNNTEKDLENSDPEKINQSFRLFLCKKYKSLSEDEQAKYSAFKSIGRERKFCRFWRFSA